MTNILDAIQTSVLEDEKIYATLHRHWFNIASQYFIIVFFSFLIAVVSIYANITLLNQGSDQYQMVIVFIASLLYIMLWLISFFIWVDYHLDVWVITSGRIINIEQKSLFRREISELDYGHVQDATSEISGIVQTALNYGNVTIQTAGSMGQFEFHNIAEPEKIKSMVMHLHRQALTKRMHPTFTGDHPSQTPPQGNSKPHRPIVS